MAKKKKLQSTAPVMTRGQLSRAERERRQIRNLYTAGVGIAVLIVLILGFAVINTYLVRPNAQVAKINDVTINRATYNKLRSWSLFQQLQNQLIQDQISQQSGSGTGVVSSQVTALQQQLKDVPSEATPDPDTVSALIDNEVLRQKSMSDFQISPSTDDLKQEAYKDFIPQPTPPPSSETPTVAPTAAPASPTITGTVATSTPTPSPTAGSPTATESPSPTLPPVPGASATAQATYNRYIQGIALGATSNANNQMCAYGCPGLSESDYLSLVIEPRLRKNLVTDKLAATGVMTQVEQIHAAHILTDTEDGAKQIRAMLDKGADFATVANEQSSEQLQNKQNGSPLTGGDLGWFQQKGSNFDQTFVDAAFQVPVGQYSQPVHTQFGWHIIKVLEKDPKRALTQDQITTEKTNLYNDWFNKAKASCTIVPAPTPTPPVPTQPVPPTAAPSVQPTSGGTGSTGAPAGGATVTSTTPGSTSPVGTPSGPAPTAPPAGATPTGTAKSNS